jgi:hypothetical protein
VAVIPVAILSAARWNSREILSRPRADSARDFRSRIASGDPKEPKAWRDGAEAQKGNAMKVRSNVRAGMMAMNRCAALRVRTGGFNFNRCEAPRVRTGVKAGGYNFNRCESLRVRTGVKAGGMHFNRCENLRR